MNSMRQAELPLQVLQQVDDLRLDRDVERGDRLVADDQVGLGGQSAGDADALALAAGELVRPAVDGVARQPHLVHQRAQRAPRVRRRICARPKLRIGSARMSRTRRRGLSDENGSWNTTCTRAAQRPQRAGRQVVDALAVEHHLAGGVLEQPQDALADGRLAAARFADQRQASRPSSIWKEMPSTA